MTYIKKGYWLFLSAVRQAKMILFLAAIYLFRKNFDPP